MNINECTILDRIRKCSLWAFLVSAASILVIEILEIWGAIETMDTSWARYGESNGWGKIENTMTIVMVIALFVLLTLLISKNAKGKKKEATVSGSTARVPASTAKKATPVKKAAGKK